MNNELTHTEAKIASLQNNLVFRTESTKLQVADAIVELMIRHGVNKVQLAEKLGTNPSFVTKILSGENNFTLETMVRIGLAFDQKLDVQFRTLRQIENPMRYLTNRVFVSQCKAVVSSTNEREVNERSESCLAA